MSVPGVTHRPPTQSGHSRACPPHPVLHQPRPVPSSLRPALPGCTFWVLQGSSFGSHGSWPPRLVLPTCSGFSALSVWVWVSQTSSGASVCSRRDPRADHGLPAAVSPVSFHQGLPPALGTGHTAISLPRLPPGCRASEAVDPVPLRCPHVHPPQGPRGMPQVRTRGSACRFQSPLNL